MAKSRDDMDEEISEAVHETRMALLARLKERAGDGQPGPLRDLAEAYAWVTSPNNAHGSRG